MVPSFDLRDPDAPQNVVAGRRWCDSNNWGNVTANTAGAKNDGCIG